MLALSRGYQALLVLHLLAVIVGFGPTVLAGAWGAKAKARGGREGLAIAEATYEVITTYAEWVIYSVPVFGILLVLTSPGSQYKFSQGWVSASLLLYIVALGVVHAVHLPNLRRMNALMAELVDGPRGGPGGPPPQVAELQSRGKKAGTVSMVLNLLLVAVVVLMVFKPGL